MIFQTLIGGYSSLELVSWANGTPAQLAAMLDAHYAGRINIANYWSVGDSRTVTLGAIDANDCTDAMAAQTVQLVLMNTGGKTLVTAEHGVYTCAFVVGFKNCLSANGVYSNTSTIYTSSAARLFLNNELYFSLPSELKSLFKTFVNTTYDKENNRNVQTEDVFSLPAAVEVFGNAGSYIRTDEGSQFAYYNTVANRVKTRLGSANDYHLRTSGTASAGIMYVTNSGDINYSGGGYGGLKGISSFGVI